MSAEPTSKNHEEEVSRDEEEQSIQEWRESKARASGDRSSEEESELALCARSPEEELELKSDRNSPINQC